MATGYGVRQVFDLPEPKPVIVTEHRAHRCRCGKCGAETRASFPEGVTAPVQYGMRIKAIVVYLLQYHLLPEDRLAELIAELFGVTLVPATIAGVSRSCAGRFRQFVEVVCEQVKTARVKHMDETGLRVGGSTQWLHIASTALLTFYRVSARRGSLLAGVTGIVVHDHWKPYFTMEGVLHALCNAHHPREPQALIEIEKEDWARKMQRLSRRACHAANMARDRGAPLKPGLIALFERSYDAIVDNGIAFHEAQPPLNPTVARGHAIRRGRPRRRTGHNSSCAFRAASKTCRASSPTRGRTFHQQSGRAGRAHDEAQAENLRRLPLATGRARLRRHPQLHLDRQETGLECHPGSHAEPRNPDRAPPHGLTTTGIPGQLRFFKIIRLTVGFGTRGIGEKVYRANDNIICGSVRPRGYKLVGAFADLGFPGSVR
jgi:transposase